MENDIERWTPVPFDDFRNVYEVSTKGIVRRISDKVERRQYLHKSGYYRVLMTSEGNSLNITIHRLVALAYIPNPNPEIFNQVGHWDDNKQNNDVENLYWTNAGVSDESSPLYPM